MINNITQDIYQRMVSTSDIDEDNMKAFLKGMEEVMRTALERERASRKPNLRMSSIGKPDRKIWLEINKPVEQRSLDGQFLIRMLYGSIVEELLLFLS